MKQKNVTTNTEENNIQERIQSLREEYYYSKGVKSGISNNESIKTYHTVKVEVLEQVLEILGETNL